MNAQTEVSPFAAGKEDRDGPSHMAPLSRRPPGHPALVGRDRELRELHAFLREAVVRGATRVLRGHPGSGKSELLEATVGMAAACGMRVLRCTGIRGGDPSELSGLLQIIWPVLGGLRRSLTAGQSQTLEMLLDGVPARDDGPRLPFAVLGVLESVSARAPLLIAVDDWDALDGPSREVLSFVARRTAGHPMGLLLTSRPHRARPASLAGLPELTLAPLTPAQSASLLAKRRPGNDAYAVRELLATAAGNPLALLELPTRSEDRLPHVPASSDRLASAMAPGAARLPTGTRDLLLVAALHPAGDLPLLLSAASGIGGAEPDFATVEPAEREGLVVVDGRRLRFSHPATAGAVVHDVGPDHCRAAHAALAAVLAPGSVRMLWHLSQAAQGPDPELAGRLEAVHRRALEQSEPTLAVHLLRRAAELYHAAEDRGRCLLRAARLAHDLGMERTARTMAHRALRHPLGPLGTRCAETLTPRGEGGEQRPPDPAGWPVPVGAEEEENALELVRITAPLLADGDAGQVDAFLAFLDGMPERADDPRLLHAMATVRPVRRAATVVARLSALRQRGEVPVRDLERLGEAALLAGDPQRALDLYRQAERHHRFHELPGLLPRVLLQQGLAHLVMGDWGQAGHAFRESGESAGQHGHLHHAAAAGLLGDLVRGLRTGTVPAAGPHDREAARGSVRAIDGILAVGTAWAQVEGGDFAAGFTTLSALLADPDRCPAALFALVPFAEAADALNVAEEARATLHGLEHELGAWCAPLVAVRLAVARAVLSDDQDAEYLYERAFALDLPRWPSLEAPLRLAHGRRLRRRHQVADSRLTLRQAATAFSMMGAEARAARIAAELRASGERTGGGSPATVPPSAAGDLLSAQELRIARLAGQGLSNRQIGEQLQLSPRTIGAYLYRVFPRLGVTARAQLPEALETLRDGLAT
ncbi:LuxR family transcriptional regulator [Streptomyces sp. NPDC049954]|uniref:LuxR family transcriptional regulator n=1 Tax=Streptomyces sp. NPDC049954 TaxID=3155779 RepID=UPI0034452B94